MEWCLDCHRHPERAIRPREKVFDLNWLPAAGAGEQLVAEYQVRTRTDCVDCHR